jgi:2,3,4,5-tetrahydropyridine-2-carboxylate N-succinyltransferase
MTEQSSSVPQRQIVVLEGDDLSPPERDVIRMFNKEIDIDPETVYQVLGMIESNLIRAAWVLDGTTYTNPAVMAAINCLFPIAQMERIELEPFAFHDKIPVRDDFDRIGVRAVPPAFARRYCHLESGAVLMPSYVNLGASVGSGTMVDTWATVGSCAQIGRNVHLSGGVGIGGVLEPPGAVPVIVGDNAFIGSRSQVVEGALVGEGAVMAMGMSFSGKTRVVDIDGSELTPGVVPSWSVVVPDWYVGFVFDDNGRPDLAASLNARGELSARYRARVASHFTPGERHDKAAINDLLRDIAAVS